MAKRRRFSAQEKVVILRRHLLDKVPVSDLCDEYRLNPNVFYRSGIRGTHDTAPTQVVPVPDVRCGRSDSCTGLWHNAAVLGEATWLHLGVPGVPHHVTRSRNRRMRKR